MPAIFQLNPSTFSLRTDVENIRLPSDVESLLLDGADLQAHTYFSI